MESRTICIEDSIMLALLYNYEATHNMILSYDSVNEFDKIVNENLEVMESKVGTVYSLDYSRMMYFVSTDEFGKTYFILNPSFNLAKAKYDYAYQVPMDVMVASKRENALNAVGLTFQGNKIIKMDESPKKLIKSESYIVL